MKPSAHAARLMGRRMPDAKVREGITMRHQRGRRVSGAFVLAILAGVAVLAAGCGHAATPAPARGPLRILTGRVEQVPAAAMSPAQLTAAEDAFGLALFGRLCSSRPSANVLLSPESAAEALGMLYAGAKGTTATALGRLLRLPAWSPSLVAALDRHTTTLTSLRQLTVSNHLFEQSGVRPTQRVLDDLSTAYRASLGQTDFGDEPAATNQINAVVAGDTHGLIPNLFPAPLPTSTRTVLTNALYLKASWLYPFPAPSPAPFHTAGGDVVRVPLMDSTTPAASYRSAGGWQSATLTYAGSRLAAVAMLPPADAAGCAVPTTAQWAALTTAASAADAAVQLPRLHLQQTWGDLQDPLAAMGLPLNGDYSGLGAGDSQISQVVQDDVMDVTPAGTTAGAATGIAVGTAAPAGHVVTLTFNRPFLLVLEDTATHTPLFLARVSDPAQP
jgi:serine protease inhibitor